MNKDFFTFHALYHLSTARASSIGHTGGSEAAAASISRIGDAAAEEHICRKCGAEAAWVGRAGSMAVVVWIGRIGGDTAETSVGHIASVALLGRNWIM